MSGQDHGAALIADRNLLDFLPHEAASLGVHSTRWLIQKYDLWIAKKRDCNRKFALVAA